MTTAPGLRLHAIAAMAANRVIGKDGVLPWRLPGDLKLFRERTWGHPVIMGRNTFLSLPKGPLPGRRNIVLSGSVKSIPGVEVIGHLRELEILGVEGDAFIIGGAKVYETTLPSCQSLILTVLPEAIEGDAFFPPFEHLFRLEGRESYPGFEVLTYLRGAEN